MRLIFIQWFSKEQILFLYQLPYQLSSESQSIIIQIKTNFMAFKASTLALTALMMLLVSTQNIVDFTYTQYDSRSGKTTRQKDVVVIKPTASIIQGYSFPDACSLAKQLEEQKTEDSRQIADYDMDSMIENLKVDFIEMLKVSEKIKNKKNNIQELSQLSGLYTNVSVVSQKQLDMLKISENKLLEINNEIGTKTADLQLMVKDAMISSGGNQFALMSVNFEIQSLKLKLQYLNNLKQKSTDQDKAKTKDQYSKYFTDLRDRFDIETDLIDNLATILQNWNEIRALRSKISSIKGKIEIVNLMIEEKEVCVKQREQIKKVQKYHHQIKSHMANLREKKKDNTNINNKYCQGVAKKLEDRVKNVLKTYDYTFQCAKGVDALKEERNNHQQELKKAEQRLRQLEKRGADDYKQKFEENRKFMKTKQEELSKFYIAKYYHNIDELDDLITKTTRQMKDAQQTRRTLGSPSNRKDVDYRKIQELVSAIKRLKGTYCQQYENYDNKAQKLWKQVQKHEAEVEYNSKMRGVYEDEINELRDLQNKFQQLRSKILLQIQSQ